MEMRNRPVKYGDIGSLVKISGLLLTGGGAASILLLPGTEIPKYRRPGALKETPFCEIEELTVEEWSDFIRRSDDPEILVGNPKIFQRKLRWEISGAVQQSIWAKDGFTGVYGGKKMGQTLLTIDHWIPLELDGKNDQTNYLTACKAENKDKGSEHPKDWCARKGYDYEAICSYLLRRESK